MRGPFLSIAYLTSAVSAFAFFAPRATSISDHSLLEPSHAPEPTRGPQIPHELLKRDTTGTVLVAPDNTCGFLNGRLSAPFSCPFTDSCLFVTATSATIGNVACCPPVGDCGIRAGCVDYNGYWSSSSCNAACRTNVYILKCTQLGLPYCNSVIFPENHVTDYFCDDAFAGTFQTAYTTYLGETDHFHKFQTEVVTLTDSTTASASGAAPSSATGGSGGGFGGSSGGASSQQSTAGFAIPIGSNSAAAPDASGASGSGAASSGAPTAGGASASSSSAAPTASSKSSTPVGAIVGGVVGGVGGLALIGAGIFFFLRYRRHHDAAADPPSYGAGQATTAPGTGPYGGGPGGAGTGAGAAYTAAQLGGKPPGQTYGPQEMAENNPAAYPPAAELYGQKQPQQTGYYAPASPLSQGSGPTTPSYLGAGAAAGAYPERTDATSPVSGHSGGPIGGSEGPVSELGSPHQSYQGAAVPAPHPGASEMSANMAGRFPTDLHYGTHEMAGSEVPR